MAHQTGLSKLEEARWQRLLRLRQLGVEPYGGRFDGTESAGRVTAGFDDDKTGQRARCAGRVVLLRNIGKLIFITLRDSSGTIQLGLSKKVLSEQWDVAKLLELGDIIGAEGELGRTKTGEITVWTETITMLGKCFCLRRKNSTVWPTRTCAIAKGMLTCGPIPR